MPTPRLRDWKNLDSCKTLRYRMGASQENVTRLGKERVVRRMTELEGFQIAGMRCWKCRREFGCLSIPMSQEDTPETIGAYLMARRILPLCIECHKANPRTISFENAQRDR